MEEILTAEQVAQILQVHPFTVLKFIKQGKLKASKLGRVYRIRKSDVDSFLDEQVEKTAEKTTVKKKKEIPKETEPKKVTSSPKKRDGGQGTTESKIEKQKHQKEPISEKVEKHQRRERDDIDHYVLELKTN